MEAQSTAHELALTKLQNQEATLKDSLAKMAALSEGLAKDKVELNHILLQVSSWIWFFSLPEHIPSVTEQKLHP